MKRSAVFDASGQHRYTLLREWQSDGPRVAFVMLNPSLADEARDDATIRRCMGFAQMWGFASMEAVNLFAYRTMKPANLKRVDDPIGAENDRYIASAVRRADQIVVAWGNHGRLNERFSNVLKLLADESLFCLGITGSGAPRHPLYLPNTTPLVPFIWQADEVAR
jgi:hypothetical protein